MTFYLYREIKSFRERFPSEETLPDYYAPHSLSCLNHLHQYSKEQIFYNFTGN